jgi:hypothetical protein
VAWLGAAGKWDRLTSGRRLYQQHTQTRTVAAILACRMTIKDDLHTLIDELDEADAREALAFLRARAELDPNVSQAYIADCIAASEEAHAPDAVLLPHEAVRTWLEAWGTPDEAAADRTIDALEARQTGEGRDPTSR